MSLTQYTWNPLYDCVIEETDGAGDVLATYTNKPQQFGPLVSQNRGGTTSQCHFDALGSTRLLTDDTGTATDTFHYDAWGNEIARTGLTTALYTWVGRWGYQYDVALARYYIRERIYNAAIALWVALDRAFVEFVSYVYESPLLYVDPSGLIARPTHLVSMVPKGGETTGDVPVQIKTVTAFDAGECGGMKAGWTIKYTLTKPAGSDGGYILQKIVLTYDINNCDNKSINDKIKDQEQDWNLPDGKQYWEVWSIPAGKTEFTSDPPKSFDDIFATAKPFGDMTKGSITWKGAIAYVSGPYPKDKFLVGRVDAAGSLPSTFKDPGITMNSAQDHNMKIDWDCCPC